MKQSAENMLKKTEAGNLTSRQPYTVVLHRPESLSDYDCKITYVAHVLASNSSSAETAALEEASVVDAAGLAELDDPFASKDYFVLATFLGHHDDVRRDVNDEADAPSFETPRG